MATGEALNKGYDRLIGGDKTAGNGKPQLGLWGTVDWFFLPHCEFRTDVYSPSARRIHHPRPTARVPVRSMMMLESKTRVSLAAALLVGLATLGSARNASASSAFPRLIAEGPDHPVSGRDVLRAFVHRLSSHDLGGPHNLKVFGKNLFVNGQLAPTNDNGGRKGRRPRSKSISPRPLPPTSRRYQRNSSMAARGRSMTATPTASATTRSAEPRLPFHTPALGEKEFCPDIAYGCGRAHRCRAATRRSAGLILSRFGRARPGCFRRLKRAPRAR